MKREFKPEMTVVRFGTEDVIATSGARSMGVSGFHDTTAKNATFIFGSYTYVNDGTENRDTLYNNMSSYFGASVDEKTDLDRGSSKTTLGNILNRDDSGEGRDFDGTYYWDSSLNVFKRQ
jgi:hypothetical protein